MSRFGVTGTCKDRGDVLVLLLFLGFEPADAEWAMDAKEDCRLDFENEEGGISFVVDAKGRIRFLLTASDEKRIRRFEAGLSALCRTRVFVHWRRL